MSQNRKPIGFFLGAGCPLSIRVNEREEGGKTITDPLIWDVAGLTKVIAKKLSCGDHAESWDKIVQIVKEDGGNSGNIELILSRIRVFASVAGIGNVRGLTAAELKFLDAEVCKVISEEVSRTLPAKDSPYHNLAIWSRSIRRERPVHLFTTNYDLLMEQALEETSAPYFDGFIGARKAFFDLGAVEDEGLLPPRWTRLWKIHGSLNWRLENETDVVRTDQKTDKQSYLIYPSHLKYDQSRKMPYLAMLDRLKAFLLAPSSLLFICGYSFADEHINDVICRSLEANPTAHVFAFVHGDLETASYKLARQCALATPNLSLLGFDKAIIGRTLGDWTGDGADDLVLPPSILVKDGDKVTVRLTDMGKLGVHVAGVPLAHRLYHFALVYSGFEHGEIVLGGESYTALATGLSQALTILGGAPHEHRSDSLSAAFRNLCADDAEDLTRRFAALAAHYGMVPTRNNRGVAHENGSIESRHGHVKDRIEQALLLRGSSDFATLEDYRTFVGCVIADHNKRHAGAIEIERAYLRGLPPASPVTWQEASVRVTSSSGFSFRHAFYTVPSRLIGHRLHLRVHDDRIEAFLGAALVVTLARGRAPSKKAGRTTTHVVDYRHIIGSLRAKPGALAGLTYRDALWPRPAYRRTWEALSAVKSARDAGRIMVGLLALAYDQGVEADLANALETILDAGQLPDLADLRVRFMPASADIPSVHVEMPGACSYDQLLATNRAEVAA